MTSIAEAVRDWNILIVDDEEEVHLVTRMVLDDFLFENSPVNMISAYSEDEAVRIMSERNDIAVMLLDVVMESEDSGLNVVRRVRDDLENNFVRIIIRTGQPGRAPESRVVFEYDINDYRDKTELTSLKMKTALTAALRGYRDLRSLEQSQRDLARTERYLSHVVAALASPLIGLDSEYRVSLWNTAAEVMTGIPGDVIRGKLLDEVPNAFSCLADNCREVGGTGDAATLRNIPLVGTDERVFNAFIYPFVSPGEIGTVILVDEVTELREKERQLQQSQKLESIGTLAAGLAHDLNNILGGITGSLSLIKLEKETSPDRHNDAYDSSLSTIEDSARRASGLVKQLLALSQKRKEQRETVDLAVVIENVMQICRSSFGKSVELESSGIDGQALMVADQAQMEQVFLNLMINAYHAVTIMRPESERQGGRISVDLSSVAAEDLSFEGEGDFWCLVLRDNGVGIPRSVREKMFDPFFTTKKKGSGTGLGLAMVNNIVSQAGGHVTVDSEPGKWTEFRVYLPKAHHVDTPLSEETAGKIESLTILFCDDDPIMRNIGRQLLAKLGHRVISSSEGREAIETFAQRKQDIDLVILDFLMPRMNGLETFRKLKELDPDVKTVLTSGFRDEEKTETALREGVRLFLQKPYTMDNLGRAVADAVAEGDVNKRESNG